MLNVGIFYPDYDDKHREILQAFALGAAKCGAHVTLTPVDQFTKQFDVAVIFGSYKYSYLPTMAKKTIIDHYQGRRLIMIESAFVKRGEYYQIGFGGFAGSADFRNENSPPDRWQAMGVKTNPWRRNVRGPVIVCGQLPRDTQVQDVDHVQWCQDVFNYYLQRDIEVKFRPHPRQKDLSVYGIAERYFDTQKIKLTLEEAKCFVTYNSTSAVDALIAGVPVIVRDKSSISWPVASKDLNIDRLKYPSRRQFFADLGYAQWTVEEMAEGLPWLHLLR